MDTADAISEFIFNSRIISIAPRLFTAAAVWCLDYLMYPVSSVMTSPGDTICLGSNPAKAEVLFLFFGNLASTDIFFFDKNTQLSSDPQLPFWNGNSGNSLKKACMWCKYRLVSNKAWPLNDRYTTYLPLFQNGGKWVVSWHCCFLLYFALFCPKEMDFSKFSDENFDVKEWVNSALRIRDDRTPIDVSTSFFGLRRVYKLYCCLCMIHRLLHDI